MWILDSTGDFLEGKRVWLRPGKKYLFGRFHRDGVRHAVNHTSISRKHMTIEISPVNSRDGLSPRARSTITITDLDSKKGTVVDERRIHGECKLDKRDEHVIQLAKYRHTLRIKWEPVILTLSASSKQVRGEDPLAHVRSRLEDLDIKTIMDYIVDHTTHVVQRKRNTAKGLQALVNGKYIVDDSYIDALVYAATPADLENDESLCPLEIDFKLAWPDPNQHLPPPGKEPTQRPAAAFAPNSARLNVFEGYTFIFGDPAQFENLQGPINNGQGKTLFYQVEDGVTTAPDIVRFMKKAAGGKGVGGERHGSGGVVLVRFRSKGDLEQWSIDVGNEVALMTDQRVIEQREFLDAILGNDASPLCRALPAEEGSSQIFASTPAVEAVQTSQRAISVVPVVSESGSPPDPKTSQPSAARSKIPRVRAYVSKMKAFDDGFDMESVPVYAPEGENININSTQTMDIETQSPSQAPQSLDTVKEDPEEDTVADLLPGARAMKRRRAEMTRHYPQGEAVVTETEAPKRKRPKLDVLEAARRHREDEEQQRKAEEDTHASDMGDVDVDQLKNLAIVEEMEIPARNAPAREVGSSNRWDDQWNGRKNFKKFRRKGEPRGRARIQTVIVPLEEVTRKDYGIGDHYWGGNTTETNSRIELADPGSEDRRGELAPSCSELSTTARTSPEPTPDPTPARRPKRTREERDSDSDDGLRFRFRRKR
ncbi:DNA damage response protein RcaA [Penicillium digitatum]|nr:DNA damage response protein RcaA [Penicillium digitatum]